MQKPGKRQENKSLKLWILVIGSMTIILFLWLISLQNYFAFIRPQNNNTNSEFKDVRKNFDQLFNDFSSTLSDLKTQVEKINTNINKEDSGKINNSEVLAAVINNLTWQTYTDKKNGLEILYPQNLLVRVGENQAGFYPLTIKDNLDPNISEDLINLKITENIIDSNITEWFQKEYGEIAKKGLTINQLSAIQADLLTSAGKTVHTFILKDSKIFDFIFLEYKTTDERYLNVYNTMIHSVKFNP